MKKTSTPRTRFRFGDSRDANGSRPTMPPRTRAGKSHPGGKHYRKAIIKLEARIRAQTETRAGLGKRPKSLPESAYKLPGSMS